MAPVRLAAGAELVVDSIMVAERESMVALGVPGWVEVRRSLVVAASAGAVVELFEAPGAAAPAAVAVAEEAEATVNLMSDQTPPQPVSGLLLSM